MILQIAAAAVGVTSLVDGISTVRFLKKGDVETNPLLGKNPSTVRVFLEGGAIIAAEIGLAFAANYFLTAAGYVVSAGLLVQSVFHVVYAVKNFRL